MFAALLVFLDEVPVFKHFRAVGNFFVSENMRVTGYEFRRDRLGDVLKAEKPFLACDLRDENDLKKEISEFFFEFRKRVGV